MIKYAPRLTSPNCENTTFNLPSAVDFASPALIKILKCNTQTRRKSIVIKGLDKQKAFL